MNTKLTPQGFSLLEVLISLLILSTAFFALAQVHIKSLQMSELARANSISHLHLTAIKECLLVKALPALYEDKTPVWQHKVKGLSPMVAFSCQKGNESGVP